MDNIELYWETIARTLKKLEHSKEIKRFCQEGYGQCTDVTLEVHTHFSVGNTKINFNRDVLKVIEAKVDKQIANYEKELSEYKIVKPLKNSYAE